MTQFCSLSHSFLRNAGGCDLEPTEAADTGVSLAHKQWKMDIGSVVVYLWLLSLCFCLPSSLPHKSLGMRLMFALL